MDLALNNLQRLTCHKTQKNKQNLFGKVWKIPVSLTQLGVYDYIDASVKEDFNKHFIVKSCPR